MHKGNQQDYAMSQAGTLQMKPKWMRLNVSCPDCGLVINSDGYANVNGVMMSCTDSAWNFTCARCKVHYSSDDFWESYRDKQAHVWSEHLGEPAHVEE